MTRVDFSTIIPTQDEVAVSLAKLDSLKRDLRFNELRPYERRIANRAVLALEMLSSCWRMSNTHEVEPIISCRGRR